MRKKALTGRESPRPNIPDASSATAASQVHSRRMALSLHSASDSTYCLGPTGSEAFQCGGDMKYVRVNDLFDQGYFWPGTTFLRNVVRTLDDDGPLQELFQDLFSILTLRLLASRN